MVVDNSWPLSDEYEPCTTTDSTSKNQPKTNKNLPEEKSIGATLFSVFVLIFVGHLLPVLSLFFHVLGL